LGVAANKKTKTKKKTACRQRRQEERNPPKPNVLVAKTPNQKDYIRSILSNDITFCIGPSGTGKSFIAAGVAASRLLRDGVDQVIVTRPLVCTGKDIGSLPGELADKIKPYLAPMEENLRHFLGRDKFGLYYNQKRIRFEPLETMRGSTYHDAIMILDEAQNCTVEQIKMFITRMGNHSTVIINGDAKQTDVRSHSGLYGCMEKLRDIEGIGTSILGYEDIQRNGIIGKVLSALED